MDATKKGLERVEEVLTYKLDGITVESLQDFSKCFVPSGDIKINSVKFFHDFDDWDEPDDTYIQIFYEEI